jgi:HAD superfamily hydrolase (TIGR01459 family)
MKKEPLVIEGLSEVIAAHDLFLIDQFGVLHDGRTLYPGALAALQAIKAAGKTSMILTNSGKRAAQNEERLLQLGLPRDSFGAVVSSGEVGWHAIDEGKFGPPFIPGSTVFLVGRRGDDYGLAGLDLTLTDEPAKADALLILGCDIPRVSLAHYKRLLAPAARAGIPALSSNPDKLMHTSRGLQPAPGAIAEIYQELGGTVHYLGKPYPDIYRYAFKLAPDVPPARVLAIGDSVEHDIAGAARMGCHSALIRGGILVEVDGAGLDNLYAEYQAWPTFVLGKLAV